MNPSGRRFAIAAAIAVMALLVTSGAVLAECGKVTVGEMNWNSARVIANVEKFILETGYGCEVELVQTATVPAMTSMVEKGEPDIASEIWINSVRESFDNGVAEGRIVSAGNVLADGGVRRGGCLPTSPRRTRRSAPCSRSWTTRSCSRTRRTPPRAASTTAPPAGPARSSTPSLPRLRSGRHLQRLRPGFRRGAVRRYRQGLRARRTVVRLLLGADRHPGQVPHGDDRVGGLRRRGPHLQHP